MNILHATDPAFPKKCRRVSTLDDELRTLVNVMFGILRESNGVGLAAPQVGVAKRLIVVEWQKKQYVLTNPEIIQHSKELAAADEGCLSMPGLTFRVPRYKWVVVQGRNWGGTLVRYKLSGWLSRIFQHEIDHVDGLFISHRAEVL